MTLGPRLNRGAFLRDASGGALPMSGRIRSRPWSPRLVDASTCLRHWDRALDDIGGDPSRENWASFRPSPGCRVKGLVGQLAHLLASSRTGRFPARLLAGDVRHAEQWNVSSARREERAESYRADLVVHLSDGGWVHIEVKIGDLDLAKTPDTTQALRRTVGVGFRRDYLLLPAADVSYWDDVKKDLDGRADNIKTLTLIDVAKALRASVIDPAESLRWRVWAATFLGAVEQQLLGFPQVGTRRHRVGDFRPTGVDVERVRLLEDLLKEQS